MKEQQEPLRYERKFLITDYSFKDVEQIIKFHPACFSEIFHQRQVNNIYFDTLGFANYYDNVEGSRERLKVRIRWYGDLFGEISKPVLEYKIKKGLLGKKDSYRLNPFILGQSFSRKNIESSMLNLNIPENIQNELLSLKPALLNNYIRKYFLSADKKFRITVDFDLNYYKIFYGTNPFLHKTLDHRAVVLELKYDSEDEAQAKEIGTDLPFMMTKNSKYLRGLELLFL
ncbi:MAG: hypothetical protein K0Q95_1400 [Bacteroidota bacterium]|jgi:hypothetical protein|nr:hypothetical protein [Bacteroidota bacterium]